MPNGLAKTVFALVIMACVVLLPASAAAQKDGRDPCAAGIEGELDTRIEQASQRSAAISEQIGLFRSSLEQGQILIPDMEVFPEETGRSADDERDDFDDEPELDLVTMSLEEMIAIRIVGAATRDDDALEEALRDVLNLCFSYRRAMRARLAEQEADRARLSECVDILRAQARAERVATRQGRTLSLLTPDVGDTSDTWPFAERRHIVIQPGEGSVRYLWDFVGACRVQYRYSIGGVPAVLEAGQEFTVSMTGSVNGTCNSAGGRCRSVQLSLGSGLERVDDAEPLQLEVGVPRAGQSPTHQCQVASRTSLVRLRVTSDQSAQLTFSIRHGSGWWPVTRYVWRSDEG